MKTSRAIPLLIAILSVSACGLPAKPDRVEYQHRSYATTISVSPDRAPPVPRIEHPPQTAMPGHFWAPGYWQWQGTRYTWVSGNWQPYRPGYTHVASHWEQRADRWHFEPARYEQHRAARSAPSQQAEERVPVRHSEQRTVDKLRTKITKTEKTVEKDALGKLSKSEVHTKEEHDVKKVGYTTERGNVNEFREHGTGRDGGNRG